MCAIARYTLILAVFALAQLPLKAQSLITATNLSHGTMYSDQVARQAGDLITIRISENTQVAEQKNTSTSTDNSKRLRVRAIPESPRIEASEGQSTVGTLPLLSLDSEREFDGEGSYNQRGQMSAMITGRVIDVLDNGNLVVEGRRTLTFGDNVKTIRITGICRSSDLNSENMVNSERLHNLQVAIEGEGPLNKAQQQGWLSRLLGVVWPF
ncbi:MAG: flagellar basal body L-ring protein FlgH [Planctomycetota bacterium]|nr:MAG: flagellar basal body L-ring protein FlgH [Planctomycetota bacterium]